MKTAILSLFGDGTGNLSMMRVIMFAMFFAVIASKFYNAWLAHAPIVWDTQDFAIMSSGLVSKLIQNTQEK